MTREDKANPQLVNRDRLREQKAELEAYIKQPSFKDLTATQKSNALQKLEQINSAIKVGEVDPAFRKNKIYREGALGKSN